MWTFKLTMRDFGVNVMGLFISSIFICRFLEEISLGKFMHIVTHFHI